MQLQPADVELHRVILENMAEGVCLVRAEDMAIVYANPRFEQIFGYDAGELVGRPVTQLNYAPDEARAKDIADEIFELLRRRGTAAYEVHNRKKDGAPFWCRARTSAFMHPVHGLVWVAVHTDITVEKEAADRLRRHEQLLQTVVDSLPVGLWITDRDGQIVSGNAAGQRIWGGARYVGIEHYGKYEGWWADTGEPIRAEEWAMARAIRSGETSVGELIRIRCFDGSYKMILNSGTPLRDGDAIVGGIVVNEDVTRLMEAEALSAGVIAAAPDAIVATDGDRRIVLFNGVAVRMFGWTADEAMGHDIEQLISANDREALDTMLAEVAESDATVTRSLTGCRRSGEAFAVEVSAACRRSGFLRRYMLVIRDITDRVRTEQELAALASRQRFLVEAGKVLAESLAYDDTLQKVARLAVPCLADACVIYLVDEDGPITPAVVHCDDPEVTRATEQALQRYPVRDAARGAGRVVRTGIPELVPTFSADDMRQSARSTEHLELLRRIGASSYLTVPLRARDEVIGAITLFHTGSGRRLGRLDLEWAELLGERAGLAIDNARLYRAAQRATRARDDVLAVVAHDIRSPLTAIVCGTEVVARVLPSAAVAAHRGVDAIRRSAKHIDRLISDLLDAAQLEAGTLTLERATIAPAEVVDEAVEMVRASAAGRTLDVAVPTELPSVEADRYRVLQVLTNLLANAVKFTPPGGRIAIAAERKNGDLLVRVRDSGPGIPADQIDHVFDRFWKASRSDRRGAGLGLAIAKGIIDAHGGKIWLESQPDAGATFCFTLPLAA